MSNGNWFVVLYYGLGVGYIVTVVLYRREVRRWRRELAEMRVLQEKAVEFSKAIARQRLS